VTPNARKNEIIGWQEELFLVKVAAVPDNGRANEELVKFLAKEWKIKQNEILILTGHTGRLKRISIPNTLII